MPSPQPAPAQPPTIHGLSLTPQTQCLHYSSPLDIIAIKHACCHKFYACITCHNALESHTPSIWRRDQRNEKAVLCGKCKEVWTVAQYLAGGSVCAKCGGGWNPGCRRHWGLYFEVDEREVREED